MNEEQQRWADDDFQLHLSATQLRLAEGVTGTGAFELDLTSDRWVTTPQVAVLFGFDTGIPSSFLADWEPAIFVDDAPKLRAALKTAEQMGVFNTEMRVRHSDGTVHWLAAKGEMVRDSSDRPRWVRGTCFDISERKALEARLLALNETLEARVPNCAKKRGHWRS